MSTSTQRERFEQAMRQLRNKEITTVMIVDEAPFPTAEFGVTAARAGTPGRYAGIVVCNGTWVHGRLVERQGGPPGRPINQLLVDFPPGNRNIATAIVDAFEAAGFPTRWSSVDRMVQVSLAEPVASSPR